MTKDRTESRIKEFTNQYSHDVVFVPHNNPPTCKRCCRANTLGLPPPEACKSCGPGSGIYRYTRYLNRSKGGARGFLSINCGITNPLARIPDRHGTGVYDALERRKAQAPIPFHIFPELSEPSGLDSDDLISDDQDDEDAASATAAYAVDVAAATAEAATLRA